MSTLQTRVRGLIRDRFRGSVNAAAKAWEVPQPTLRRIAEGITAHPRADVLARIARGTDTSVEWLLTGAGVPPADHTAIGDRDIPVLDSLATWRRLVLRLGLLDTPPADELAKIQAGQSGELEDFSLADPETVGWLLHHALMDIPGAPYFAGLDVGPPLEGPEGEPWPMTRLHEAAIEALDASAKTWTTLLTVAMEELGPEALRLNLRLTAFDIIMGYSRMAMFLRLEQKDELPRLLSRYALWAAADEPDTWLPTHTEGPDIVGPLPPG